MKIAIILAALVLTGCAAPRTTCTSGHQIVTHHIVTKPNSNTTKVKEIQREDLMTECKTK